MRSSVYKRAASLLICVAFLLSVTFVKPQKAEAVALTSTAVVAAVAAVMTACGVTYWANTQQDAISYLGGKIDDYLDTLSNNEMTYEEWLGLNGATSLFTVISNGVLSFGTTVANKILDFISWFNQEENVVSNGQAVGVKGAAISGIVLSHEYGTVFGSENFTYNGNTITCNFTSRAGAGTRIYIPISSIGTANLNVTCTLANYNNSLQMEAGLVPGTAYTTGSLKSVNVGTTWTYNYQSNYNYIYLGLHPSSSSQYACTGTATFKISGSSLSTSDKVLVTPSSSVSVPEALDVGQTLDITTNANISQGASVEDASSAILDTVVTAGGLSSTNDVGGEAVPSESVWLWNAITSLPETIASALKDVLLEIFIPDQAFIDDFFTNLNSIFNNRFSILSFPFALLGTFITKVASMSSSEPIISWPNIYEHFSGKLLIAAGSYNLNSILANQAIANMYAIYMIVIKAIISFQFVAFLYAWFCDVFHMNNDDFANPFDIVEETEPEDGDGYDGSWSSW